MNASDDSEPAAGDVDGGEDWIWCYVDELWMEPA